MSGYRELVQATIVRHETRGIERRQLPACLREHQRHAVDFALGKGCAALFLDTGLGKSLCAFAWADNVSAETGKPVLMLAPLGVTGQHAAEARRFGYDQVRICRSAEDVGPGLNLANYERLHLFDPEAFGGIVLDESSIIKNFSGVVTRRLMEFGAMIPFRLACTATPAPNDHMELGQHAQFLGVMSSSEMLSRWFIADQSEMGRYRLKRHAVNSFWDWVSSWARCAEKRRTADDRAARLAELVLAEPDESWIVWVDTDYDADAVKALLPDATEVHGRMTPEQKEEGLSAFSEGRTRILITKASIAGFGLNWQHCARVGFAGLSYSYEAFYQAVRRCWRYGQERPVLAHVLCAETEEAIWQAVVRKRDDHDAMKVHMRAAMARAVQETRNTKQDYAPGKPAALPAWLEAA